MEVAVVHQQQQRQPKDEVHDEEAVASSIGLPLPASHRAQIKSIQLPRRLGH